jgi:hypothetical protein
MLVPFVLLVLVGNRAEGRRERGGVDGTVGLGSHENVFNRLVSVLKRNAVAVLGAEELLRKGHGICSHAIEWRRGSRHNTGGGLELVELLEEGVVGLLCLTELGL